MPQPRQRIEVLVDAPLIPRITALAEAAGIPHHMVVPTVGGHGPHGRWRRDEVTGTTAKHLVILHCLPDAGHTFIEALRPLIASHDLQVTRAQVDLLGS